MPEARSGACAVPKGPLGFWGTLPSFGTFCKHFRPPQSIQAEKNKLAIFLEGNWKVFLAFWDNCPALASSPRATSNGFAFCSQVGRASPMPRDGMAGMGILCCTRPKEVSRAWGLRMGAGTRAGYGAAHPKGMRSLCPARQWEMGMTWWC